MATLLSHIANLPTYSCTSLPAKVSLLPAAVLALRMQKSIANTLAQLQVLAMLDPVPVSQESSQAAPAPSSSQSTAASAAANGSSAEAHSSAVPVAGGPAAALKPPKAPPVGVARTGGQERSAAASTTAGADSLDPAIDGASARCHIVSKQFWFCTLKRCAAACMGHTPSWLLSIAMAHTGGQDSTAGASSFVVADALYAALEVCSSLAMSACSTLCSSVFVFGSASCLLHHLLTCCRHRSGAARGLEAVARPRGHRDWSFIWHRLGACAGAGGSRHQSGGSSSAQSKA